MKGIQLMKSKQKRAATIISHSFFIILQMEMKRGKDDDDDDEAEEGLLRERKDQLRDARDELSAMATKDFPSWLS